MAEQLFVLYEHAAGYALFRIKEFEEVAQFLPMVEKSVLDLSRFQAIAHLVSFSPFKSAAHALDNINSVSEGVLNDDLNLFLESNLPKSGKKTKVTLGVGEGKIGAAIMEVMNVTCQSTGVVPEIIRGIRYHFHKLVKGFTPLSSAKAQLGLGHSYSRAKVKFNVNRVDNMIIQSISLLDQLDKDINTFSMRIREWYSYHFPELIKVVPENYMFARAAKLIGDRKTLNEDKVEQLEEIVMDSARVQAILDAARSSMGMDISPIDLINIERFAVRVISLAEYRKSLQEYLRSRMHSVAPNLSALIGEVVGAKLISQAGSLTNLAKYPASTVQILGAEKALFRALKTRGNTPKYGLIFHSTFIGRAATQNKGRISRYLANKCSIASRIDCFSEIPTSVYGEKLKGQVEERLKFFDTGEIPRKNVEVMQDALQEVQDAMGKSGKKKKKKKNLDDTSTTPEQSFAEDNATPKKKKRKHSENEAMDVDDEPVIESVSSKKKKKKTKNDASLNATLETTGDEESFAITPKKKKKAKGEGQDESFEFPLENGSSKKKKKKKKNSL